MEFTIDRKEFTRAITKMQGIVEKKGDQPILGSILIRKESEDRITLFGTSLEISLKVPCPASNIADGRMALDSKKLYEIVRELPDGPVICSRLDNQQVQISAGKSKFKLMAYNPDDYPAIEPEKSNLQFIIKRADFMEMIGKTLFSVGENDNRFVLNGMLLFFKKNGAGASVRFVGTDGHRLSVTAGEVACGSTGEAAEPVERKLIVPKKAMYELKKLAAEMEDETITLECTGNQLNVRIAGIHFSARLLEGQYPNYALIIPKETPVKATFKREDLIRAIQRVSVVSQKSGNVTLSVTRERASLSSESDSGQAEDQIPVTFEGEEYLTAFNARYLEDLLSAFDHEEVILTTKDPLSPAKFNDPLDPNTLWIVMPMRVPGKP